MSAFATVLLRHIDPVSERMVFMSRSFTVANSFSGAVTISPFRDSSNDRMLSVPAVFQSLLRSNRNQQEHKGGSGRRDHGIEVTMAINHPMKCSKNVTFLKLIPCRIPRSQRSKIAAICLGGEIKIRVISRVSGHRGLVLVIAGSR